MVIGQAIGYLLLLQYDDYLGFLIGVILGSVCACCYIVARMAELIEPSKVSGKVMWILLSGWLAPFLSIGLFVLLRGSINWG